MTAKERIKVLDQLSSHYSEYQHNLLENYKNQLSIFIGVENECYSYRETLLQPELILHPLYEAIYNESDNLINEVEAFQFEQQQYLKKIDNDKKKGIDNYDSLKEKLEQFTTTYHTIKEKNDWQIKKSEIHDLIFKKLLPKNKYHTKEINAILNSDFYNEIDSLPIAESVNRLLDAYEKVVPIYENIFKLNKDSTPLNKVVELIEISKNINPTQHQLYADEDSISDFLYLWNLKNKTEINDTNCKIAKTNNLLYYINKNGWSDTVIVNKLENHLLVSEEIMVFDAVKINANYLLLLLNLPCYREIGHFCYHRKNNKNAVLNFSIPVPNIDIQNYFSEAVDKYFELEKKNSKINNLMIEVKNILDTQGEIAAHYFLDMELNQTK